MEFTEPLFVYEVSSVDLVVASAALVSHPISRLVVRVVGLAGALSSIVLLMRQSVTARYIALMLFATIGVLFITGCAPSHVSFKEVQTETREVAPVSGVYCHETLVDYQDALVSKLKCMDCEIPRFSELTRLYDECVLKEKEDAIMLNPFNRIRGL